MLYTHLTSVSCHRIGLDHDDREKINEYAPRGTNQQASVYSAQCVIPLVRSFGVCEGCHTKHELINGHCETCRAMGANEQQCLKPSLIKRRSATGRKNSEKSMWRNSRL